MHDRTFRMDDRMVSEVHLAGIRLHGPWRALAAVTLVDPDGGGGGQFTERTDAADPVPGILRVGPLSLPLVSLEETRG